MIRRGARLFIAVSLAVFPSASFAGVIRLGVPPVVAGSQVSLAPAASSNVLLPASVLAMGGSLATPAAEVLPAGVDVGRQSFDGASAKTGAAESVLAEPAPRGDSIRFGRNQKVLPTRMFSDQTKISPHLIMAIDEVEKTLDIAIYELAHREIYNALKRAKDRGVSMRILLDQGHVFPERSGDKRSPEIQALIDEGFALRTLRGGDRFGIMHNKFAIFDGALLETGSYNWGIAADTLHFENALFIDEASRIASYQRNWDWMWSLAKPVDPQKTPALDTQGSGRNAPPAPQDAEEPIHFNGTTLRAQSYTPRGAAEQISRAISKTTKTLLIASFSFSNVRIMEALKDAKNRGVAIRIVFDRQQYRAIKEMAEMARLGFNVRLSNGKDSKRGVMHNKFGVFDGALTETGSINWTTNGEENNFENATFSDSPDDAAGYAAYFERIWAQAQAPTAEENSASVHGIHQFEKGLLPSSLGHPSSF